MILISTNCGHTKNVVTEIAVYQMPH